ncbi:hypothetical protein CUR178_07996 [Leishmania enriettii]|uniref:Uncharacterized protein n=1 Tax=Leishmania enriettii TaxID=5663 RepID=A0A836H694_LEIEN|nr:hypothetical protein CUR178_07996 [Leishmania enriettii]
MPAVASRDFRASWEIPYDFHPRIHAYPGSRSVVRAYMDGPLPTADAATAPRHQRAKRLLRQYRPSPCVPVVAPAVTAPEADQSAAGATTRVTAGSSRASAPALPQKPGCSPPRRRRQQRKRRTTCRSEPNAQASPLSCPLTDASRANAPPECPSAPIPRLHTSAQAGDEEQSSSAQSTALNKESSPAVPLSTSCRVPQRPASAATGLTRRLRSSHSTECFGQRIRALPLGPSPGTAPAPPAPAAAAAAAHTGYRHRTKSDYSLPPSYAAYRAQWQQQPVPTIRVADQYGGPPAPREYRLDERQVRHASREDFLEALVSCVASGGQEAVPHSVVDAFSDTKDARSFDPWRHNYNTMITNAFHDSVEERAARLQATESRMWKRMILNVAPLVVAHQYVVEAGGVSVLDSGHVSSPIRIFAVPGAADACAGYGDGSVADGNEAMAVVVRPFPDELLSDAEALRVAEAQRRWPKGREWDRQAAIQRAVGATAQEAIIDLGIDPRYRHPGDRPGS